MARIFGSATPGSKLADSDAFFQQRVALYIKILFFFFLVFTLLNGFKVIVTISSPEKMAKYGYSIWASFATVSSITAFLAWDWWYLSRQRPCRQQHARVFEAGGTVAGSVVMALNTPLLPPGLPEIVLLFPILLSLVIRAAIVPSSPRRTLLVGLLSVGALCALVAVRSAQLGDAGSNMFMRHSWVLIAFWGLFFSVATAIVSRVIYGLQKSMREAMQLGNYTLEQKIGEGGMGMVYLARHAILRRPTAVKLLPPEKAGAHTIARFEREVQNSSELTHPNTVQIFDYGRTPEGIFYYVMEYLEGVNLSELVELEGPQSPGRVIHILAQVAHALAEAHERGLIHRDIKPANIVLCNRGGVADMAKVVDFGLVKNIGSSDEPTMTSDNSLTGTPLYMSPEAFSAPDDVDGRTDLYSLGAVGFYLLTGEHVFAGSNAVTVAGHHMHSEPDRPSARLGKEVPADLEDVILEALAKKPGERFDDALAMRRALLGCHAATTWGLNDAATWWAHNHVRIQKRCEGKCESIDPGMANTIAVNLEERLIA